MGRTFAPFKIQFLILPFWRKKINRSIFPMDMHVSAGLVRETNSSVVVCVYNGQINFCQLVDKKSTYYLNVVCM
jgi:hypothetical protein